MPGPTLKDVAQRAGVHPGTASRALNPETRSRVNAATVRRVESAARTLGYVGNPIARSLRTARTLTVGMLIPDLTNPLFPPIVRGVEDVLAARDYTVLLANTDSSPERESQLYDALRSRRVDGFIFGTALTQHPLTTRAAREGIPVVLVNRLTDDMVAPAVMGDDASGVAQVVHHLADLGHTALAYIAGPQSTSSGVIRLRAFRQTVADRGLVADPSLVVVTQAWTEDEGADALRALLDRGTRFTAVIAGNDMLALGCYDALRERGIACPKRISVAGFNDMPFLDKLSPPLTSVHVPTYEIGAEAARLLLDQIAERPGPVRVVTLPTRLVPRGSTAAPESTPH
jgi:LacI family transcriptional regulator